MRFAVPTDDRSHVAAHTGRCREYVIYELGEDGSVRAVDFRLNPQEGRHHALQERLGEEDGCRGGDCHEESAHGDDHKHGDLYVMLADCDAVIALGMGPRLQRGLANKGIKVFFTRDQELERVANRMALGGEPVSGLPGY